MRLSPSNSGSDSSSSAKTSIGTTSIGFFLSFAFIADSSCFFLAIASALEAVASISAWNFLNEVASLAADTTGITETAGMAGIGGILKLNPITWSEKSIRNEIRNWFFDSNQIQRCDSSNQHFVPLDYRDRSALSPQRFV